MSKFTRRDFLIKSSFLTALLSLPGFIGSKAEHVAGLANEVAEFVEEATYVASTYGEHEGWYKGNYSDEGPRWMFWACEVCGYKDNYFESCKCEGCGECWENVTVDGRSGWGPCLGHCDEG